MTTDRHFFLASGSQRRIESIHISVSQTHDLNVVCRSGRVGGALDLKRWKAS